MQSAQLLQLLSQQTQQIITQAEELNQYDLADLTWREQENSWNILECLEHLNLYGDFYLPQIAKKISNSNTKADPEFKSGWLGAYFANSMLPKAKLNKMKTFANKNPLNAALDKEVIRKFLKQQNQLLGLLQQSEKISLNKVTIETTLSSLIRLKLGDMFQFLINHILRHLQQINNIEEAMKKA